MKLKKWFFYLKNCYIVGGLVFFYALSVWIASLVMGGVELKDYIPLFLVGCFIILGFTFSTRLNSVSLSRSGISEGVKILVLNGFLAVSNVVISLVSVPIKGQPVIFIGCLYFLFSVFLVFVFRVIFSFRMLKFDPDAQRVLIIGAGQAGETIARELYETDKINYRVVGFVDDDVLKINSSIGGVPIYGPIENVVKIAKKTDAQAIFVAMPSASASAVKHITELCIQTKLPVKTLPGLYQLVSGNVSVSKMRDVSVEDLLGRAPIRLNTDEIMGYIEGQVVMVTGGGGSIGSELCRQIAKHNPKQLIIFDIYENNAYDIEMELRRNYPYLNLLALIGSIRDSVKLEDTFSKYRPDIVFHAAAHKHVPLMETSPNEAVKNNVIGTYKLVKTADKYKVKRFVQISTDKAVNPTNVMGATKRICEMIIQTFAKRSETKFVAVRFGNVLGSNGSVIPLFKKQIAEGGPVTVTHKDIIRYFMTIPEAVSLVLQAGAYANGGEIFVLDMGEQVRIYDLAENLIRLSGYEPNVDIPIVVTGLRPGEKLYEERLMNEEGMQKTANDRISIGKPIDIDEDKLFKYLDLLYEEAYKETDRMKELVSELVPTYKIDKR